MALLLIMEKNKDSNSAKLGKEERTVIWTKEEGVSGALITAIRRERSS